VADEAVDDDINDICCGSINSQALGNILGYSACVRRFIDPK